MCVECCNAAMFRLVPLVKPQPHKLPVDHMMVPAGLHSQEWAETGTGNLVSGNVVLVHYSRVPGLARFTLPSRSIDCR